MMVAMTWPQYQRHECSVDGQVIRLRTQEAEILLLLLLADPGRFISKTHLIEALWPDPDLEPNDAPLSYMHVYMTRLRKRGVVIENLHSGTNRGGWRIPREARGRTEPVQLAA